MTDITTKLSYVPFFFLNSVCETKVAVDTSDTTVINVYIKTNFKKENDLFLDRKTI